MKQEIIESYPYFRLQDVLAGLLLGCIANICGIWLVLSSDHFLAPEFMGGIVHKLP